jgi:splicing factor 3A subunit 3
MDSVIEVQRQTHEEIERYQRALYTLLSQSKPTHETNLRLEHNASQILDRISSRVTALNNIYLDEDARKAEMDSVSPAAQLNDLSEFYSRLVKIQEHHSKYPDSVPEGLDLELSMLLDNGPYEAGEEEIDEEDRTCSQPIANDTAHLEMTAISLLFSGEEAFGKYLDLYANHTTYNNLKNIGKRLGYLQYLDLLLTAKTRALHSELSTSTRFSKDYEL